MCVWFIKNFHWNNQSTKLDEVLQWRYSGICYELQLKRISNRNRIKTKIAYYQRIIFMGTLLDRKYAKDHVCVCACRRLYEHIKPGHSSWLVMIRPADQSTVHLCCEGAFMRWCSICKSFAVSLLLFRFFCLYFFSDLCTSMGLLTFTIFSQCVRLFRLFFLSILFYPWKLIADRSIY